MAILNLLIALLLPWFVGTLLLGRVAFRLGRVRYGLPLLAGYGFLLGQVLVAALLTLQNLVGLGIGFYPATIILAAAAFALLRTESKGELQPSADPVGEALPALIDRRERWLVAGVATLLLAHAVPSLIEILWRPLFPWDAWTTWALRAKVWFGQGELLPFVASQQWPGDPEQTLYTIPAHSYPTLVSLIQTWVALALGQWSDTLVNLPWLLCGGSIGLVLFGHARLAGLPLSAALLLCYLLFSLPIIHTHLSLAGYADLWQAAFTSSALSALLIGRLKRDGFLVVIGFAVALAGIWVKQEGSVWLLVFALIWLLLHLSGRAWLGVVLLTALGTGVWLYSGSLVMELPLLGKLGIAGNELYFPGSAPKRLIYHDAGEAVLANLFLYANWNLFGYLLVLLVPLLMLPPAVRLHRIASLFLLIPLAAILFIFLWTEEGVWAESFTAVNRLFIHFAPCWMLLTGLVVWPRISGSRGEFS